MAVFDIAGTTVHDGDAVHRCLQEALRAAARLDVTRDDCNRVMGIPKPIAVRDLLVQYARPADHAVVATVMGEFETRMTAHYRTSDDVRPMDGAEEVFADLRSAGVKVVLDTGFDRRITDVVLARLGWDARVIDLSVCADDVANGRPAPDMIQLAMRRLGVQEPRRTAKIGDTPADLLEGLAAGCGWNIGVTNGSHTAEQLRPHPHTHLVASVADVAALLTPSAAAAL